MGKIKMCKNKALVIILFIASIAASAQAQTAAASGSGNPSSPSQGQVAEATKPLNSARPGSLVVRRIL